MGKQIVNDPSQALQVQQNAEVNKKPLNQYLPYQKYINTKIKIYKKKLSKCIKHINLNKTQIKKAVECLIKFAQQNRSPTDLTGRHDYLYLQLEVSRIPQQHSVRPIQIKLPNPIYSSDLKTRYTIITSDQIEDKFIQDVDKMNTPMLSDVLSYQKIKKNYKGLKDKRQLIASNDLFFCDWKVYNLLRQPLGKLFYQEKKFPFPIDCDGQVPQHLRQQYQNYQSYINGLAGYTYTMLGNGPVYTIKIGKTTMSARDLVKNVMHGAYGLAANILDNDIKQEHIRSIALKTYNSPSLPVYSYLTEQQIKAYKNK